MISYAYVHAPATATSARDVFYVGKGTLKRARKIPSERNVYYKRVVSKLGIPNVAVGVIECSSDAIAFDLEVGVIKCLRRMGAKLTNLQSGGEGKTAYLPGKEIALHTRARSCWDYKYIRRGLDFESDPSW